MLLLSQTLSVKAVPLAEGQWGRAPGRVHAPSTLHTAPQSYQYIQPGCPPILQRVLPRLYIVLTIPVCSLVRSEEQRNPYFNRPAVGAEKSILTPQI